jgi:hypothetical protein
MDIGEHFEELAAKYATRLDQEELTQREYDVLMGGLRDTLAELDLHPIDFPAEPKVAAEDGVVLVVVGGDVRKVSVTAPIKVSSRLMELRDMDVHDKYAARNEGFRLFDGNAWVEARLDQGPEIRIFAQLSSDTDTEVLRARLHRILGRVATNVIIHIE